VSRPVLLIVAALPLAALAAAALHAAGADRPTGPPLPDLDPAAPTGLALQRPPGARAMRLGWATTITNRGPGALRLHARSRGDSRARSAVQTTPDGRRVLAARAGTLRYVTGYGHRHFHLQGLARYTLTNLASGRVLRDHKQGFCLHHAADATPGRARNRPRAPNVVLGLAPGRSDTYEPQLEGQSIAITRRSAPTGTYLLTQTIDPHLRLCQLTRANDSAAIRLRLTWRPDSRLPRLRVLRACPDTPTCP
jgi:Lysyl oxidase